MRFKNDNLFYTSLTQNDVISGFDEDLIYSIESIFKKYLKIYKYYKYSCTNYYM